MDFKPNKIVNLKNFNNDWYNPGKNVLLRFLWYYVNVVFFVCPLNPLNGLKIVVLRFFGAKIGTNVVIKPSVNIKYPWKLTIGNNVWIGESVWIDNLASISIGNNVCISQGAMLLTGNHNYKKDTFDLMIGAIILEDGVWISAKSVVCPGVRCRSHSILGVNSVATKDLEAYHIYQGNPCVSLRKRIIQ